MRPNVRKKPVPTAPLKFTIQLNATDSGRYCIYLMEEDKSNSEGSRLVNEMLIFRTNRFVRVDEMLLPMITDMDYDFAYFGPSEPRKGKAGRKVIIQNFDGYSITFDRSGKIYKE